MSPSDSTTEDLSRADVGIVYALPQEAGPWLDRLDRLRKVTGHGFAVRGGWWGDCRIALVESGVGRKLAARATRALIEGHDPGFVLSVGFAGSLAPEVRFGDIVMADRVKGLEDDALQIDLRISPEQQTGTPGLHVGTLLTVDQIVRSVDEKQALGREHDALAVDMETLAVAQVCQDSKRRFLSVRAVSDDLETDLPPEVLSVLGATRTFRAGAVMGALIKRPGSYRDLWKLREKAHTAAERLAAFLEGVVDQLL